MKTALSWWQLVKWGIVAVALAGLGFYAYRHLDEFRTISNINPVVLLWVVLVNIVTQVVGATRSHAVMRFIGLEISFLEWLRLLVFARILNVSVPQSGNVYRAAVLKVRHGFLIKNYIGAYSAYLILWFLSAVCFTITLILVTEPGLEFSGYPMVAVLIVLTAVLVTGLYALARMSTSGKDVFRRWGAWPAAVNETFQTVIVCVKNVKLIGSIVVWGALTFFLGSVANWICFADLGSFPGLARIGVYNFISGIFSFITVTPGNIGIREAAYGLVGSGMQELAATGIIVALILRLTGFISLLLMGLLFAGADMLKRSKTANRDESIK